MATYSLSGSGVQTLTAGCTQLAVTLTARSPQETSGQANPPNRMGDGLIRFGSASGYYTTRPIDADTTLLDVPAYANRFGYALLRGATASAVEIFNTAGTETSVSPVVVAVQSINSMGAILAANAIAAPATATINPTPNIAYLIPFWLAQKTTFTVARFLNGTAVAGNIDLGLYDLGLSRLASTGSTAQAGTSQAQAFTVSVTLQPGNYYMAFANNNASATAIRQQFAGAALAQIYGELGFASSFPLPSSLSAATPTGVNFFPVMSWANR